MVVCCGRTTRSARARREEDQPVHCSQDPVPETECPKEMSTGRKNSGVCLSAKLHRGVIEVLVVRGAWSWCQHNLAGGGPGTSRSASHSDQVRLKSAGCQAATDAVTVATNEFWFNSMSPFTQV